MSDAEELRFKAFLSATSAEARDWIAYLEFEEAIREASKSAAMVNAYDGGHEGVRELDVLELAASEMFFNVLSSVDLGTILANVHGVGLAVRFGVIEPKAEAVDWISSNEDFERLAAQGHAAERADDARQLAEAAARGSPGSTSSEG